tara:strand:- start:20493 stop:20675 length:183 start_codon:yes stop_codon:yes gene_type:complete
MISVETIESVKKAEYNNELCEYIVVADSIIYNVPIDTANTDYQAIQEWAAVDGNSIADAD